MGGHSPFRNVGDVYETIDRTKLGDIRWQMMKLRHPDGQHPDDDTPPWMKAEYEVWFRDPRLVLQDMIGNIDFDGQIDYAPKKDFDVHGQREVRDFMSGDFAWKQAVSSCQIALSFTSGKTTLAIDRLARSPSKPKWGQVISNPFNTILNVFVYVESTLYRTQMTI